MKNLVLLFICFFSFSFSQLRISQSLQGELSKLDSLMSKNSAAISNVLSKDITFGHSNGWVQKYDDLVKDFSSNKVVYKEVKQLEILDFKLKGKFATVFRKIAVSGTYKTFDFSMNLLALEVWLKQNGKWLLYSRQSVELKQ